MCLGSAFDILRAGRPPRATFVGYPLGHSAGKPFDTDDQISILTAALSGLEHAPMPGTLLCLPNRWDTDGDWQQEAASNEGQDTRQPRDETPQFQLPADREAALASGALTGGR